MPFNSYTTKSLLLLGFAQTAFALPTNPNALSTNPTNALSTNPTNALLTNPTNALPTRPKNALSVEINQKRLLEDIFQPDSKNGDSKNGKDEMLGGSHGKDGMLVGLHGKGLHGKDGMLGGFGKDGMLGGGLLALTLLGCPPGFRGPGCKIPDSPSPATTPQQSTSSTPTPSSTSAISEQQTSPTPTPSSTSAVS
ncbi:MAG: hypothetical protein FJX30_00685, partial [Alphaproteobacteria bacterium]|nr:hypothetical protein [Alphaproteobacteria bacterium]